MPENTTAAPTPASNTASPAENAPGNNAAQYVTKEEHAAILARLQEVSALVGGLRNEVKAQKPKPAEPQKEDATLTARLARLEANEKRAAENLRFTSLKSAAMAKGVPEKRAEALARLTIAERGDAIEVDSDFRVLYRESEDKAVPVQDWVGAFLQTEDGEFFMPPKSAASSDGLRGGGKPASAAHPFSKLTYQELMDKARTDYAGYSAYVREHPDEFASKKKR